METTTSYHLAVALNNAGVAALPHDLPTAMDCFRRSIHALQVNDAAASCAEQRTLFAHILAAGTRTNEDADTLADMNHHHAFVQGINLIPSPSAYSPEALTNLAVASAVVVFNIAVAYHRMGLLAHTGMDKQPNETALAKAQSFYDRSQAILCSLPTLDHQSLGRAIADFCSMTIHNNLAVIAYFLCDYEDSSYHFDQLLLSAAASAIVESVAYDPATCGILNKYKMVYLGNAIMMKAPSTAPAA